MMGTEAAADGRAGVEELAVFAEDEAELATAGEGLEDRASADDKCLVAELAPGFEFKRGTAGTVETGPVAFVGAGECIASAGSWKSKMAVARSIREAPGRHFTRRASESR